jgi:hypothetical protein
MKNCCVVKTVRVPVAMIANVAMGSARLIVETLMIREPFQQAVDGEIVKLLISGFQVIDYRIPSGRSSDLGWGSR